MEQVEVETIQPHQYRQKDRIVGERYPADGIHVNLLETLKWARRISQNTEPAPESQPKPAARARMKANKK
jgi:hypothetical protein